MASHNAEAGIISREFEPIAHEHVQDWNSLKEQNMRNSKIGELFKQIDLDIVETEKSINQYFERNPEEAEKLLESNPLAVLKRQLIDTK